jgi:Zn-dependent alcohol dehydrogenase
MSAPLSGLTYGCAAWDPGQRLRVQRSYGDKGSYRVSRWKIAMFIHNKRLQCVGASVAVVGLRGVGLAALIGAQAAGARQIIAVDLSEAKLDQARALGATHTINAGRDGAIEHIDALTSGGVEFAFEFAGAIRALDLAYRIIRRGGSTVTAGLPPFTALWPLPAMSLVAEERTLKGSHIGTSITSIFTRRAGCR